MQLTKSLFKKKSFSFPFIDEKDLVISLKKGNPSAIKTLYQCYSANLMGVLMDVVKQRETAEDLLQECFIKIIIHIHTYDEKKSTLFTWMLSVTRNTAIDHKRRKSSRNQKMNINIDELTDECFELHKCSFNIDVIGINIVVSKLPPRENQMISLIYYQGFTQAEVSVKLKMPIGSVKTMLRRAITRMRYLLDIAPQRVGNSPAL